MTGYGIFGTAVMFLMMQTSQQGMCRTNSLITIVSVKTTAGKYSPENIYIYLHIYIYIYIYM